MYLKCRLKQGCFLVILLTEILLFAFLQLGWPAMQYNYLSVTDSAVVLIYIVMSVCKAGFNTLSIYLVVYQRRIIPSCVPIPIKAQFSLAANTGNTAILIKI